MAAMLRQLVRGVALLSVASFASAQQALPGTRMGPGIPGVPPLLQRVEQGVADIGPLSDTLREMDFQIDLRNPVGFSNVYRVPGRPDLLMRSSGAVYAVFPQSVYVQTEEGIAAKVPAGTIFSIGMPAPWSLPQRQIQPTMQPPTAINTAAMVTVDPSMASRRDTRINTMVGGLAQNDGSDNADGEVLLDEDDIRLEQPTIAQPPEPGTLLRTIATDEMYRAARLAELLRRAAQATRGGTGR